MRVGVDVGGLGPLHAGVARYLWNMMAAMMAASPDVEFVLYAPRRIDIPLEPGNWRLRVDSGLCTRPYSLWLQRRCPALMAEDRVDVIWGQNHQLPLRLTRPCLRVLTVHDLTAVLYPKTMPVLQRLVSRFMFRRAVQAADLVMADSAATARLLESCLLADASKVVVVYPGIDRSFAPVPQDRARRAIAEAFGLTSEYLLTVSTIEPRKDHATLLRALELVPSAPLLVLSGGLGWKYERILRKIQQMEARGRVKYLGRVDDGLLPALYSAARLLVYASLYEGFGLPVLEAMACGCPVLCTWSSSLPEVGGSAVRYCRPHDVSGMASQLTVLCSDAGLLGRMSALGLDGVARFSYRTAAERALGVIRDGLAARAAGRRHSVHCTVRAADTTLGSR